ncbi:MAG TPA: signal peptide peptidase SppA [Pantanalinema sp.]
MRTDRILAFFLIAACLLAAVAGWWRAPRERIGTGLVMDGAGGAQVAIIDVYGTIADGAPDDGLFGSRGASATRLIKAIRAAEKDKVKAILLRVNSPGGTAAASQMVYEELMRLRKKGTIKIVTGMGDVAASGGYYIAAASDHIVANPATTTGSIGVILHIQNLQKLFDKIGIGETTIQSGPRKDILSPFRAMRPDERALLQALVNDTYQQFLDAVSAGRKLPIEKLKPLADGRVFTGNQASRVGLVDSLGNYQDALTKAASLSGIKGEPRTRNYTSGTLFEDVFPRFESKLPGWAAGLIAPDPKASWNKIPLTLME